MIVNTANLNAPRTVVKNAVMGGVRVTKHAARRWAERVDGRKGERNSIRDAISAIHMHDHAIEIAAAFGADTVKLGSNHRLKLAGSTVLTVLPLGRR